MTKKKELIKIDTTKISGKNEPTVNARNVWKKLKSKKEYSQWLPQQIKLFQEGVDYINFTNFEVSKKSHGNIKSECFLTLDTAKHICMMSRCDEGMKMRQYFINYEKEGQLLKNVKALNKADIKTMIERERGKEERSELALAIQKLDNYFTANESKNGKFMYPTITKLIYKELFNISGSLKRLKGIRDYMNATQLRKLSRVEMMIAEAIETQIEAAPFYNDIYPVIKEAVKSIANIVGVTPLPLKLIEDK